MASQRARLLCCRHRNDTLRRSCCFAKPSAAALAPPARTRSFGHDRPRRFPAPSDSHCARLGPSRVQHRTDGTCGAPGPACCFPSSPALPSRAFRANRDSGHLAPILADKQKQGPLPNPGERRSLGPGQGGSRQCSVFVHAGDVLDQRRELARAQGALSRAERRFLPRGP